MNKGIASRRLARRILLLVGVGLTIALVMGLWMALTTQAQGPQEQEGEEPVTLSAEQITGLAVSTTTRQVSGIANVATATLVSQTSAIIPLSARVPVPFKITVQPLPGTDGCFALFADISLSGIVPVNITNASPSSASVAMSGRQATHFTPDYCILGRTTFSRTANRTVNGQVAVSVSNPPQAVGVFTPPEGGTVQGPATIWVNGNVTIVQTAYLPQLSKDSSGPTPEVYWSDDFSTDKGWLNYGCDSKEITGGVMRVTLDSTDTRCYLSPPAGVFLKEGTFIVQARRTSDSNDRGPWYGLFFNTSDRLDKQHWALEARPSGGNPCETEKGLLWLSYITDGYGTGYKYPDKCTNALKTSINDWNTLKVIRNGENVKVYINTATDPKFDVNDSHLFEDGYGLFDLELISVDKVPVVVEFDNFELRTGVTP